MASGIAEQKEVESCLTLSGKPKNQIDNKSNLNPRNEMQTRSYG
jgi:hypothetical protein